MYERIRNLREDMDMTQQTMADKLFINRRTYSSYETGVRGIPIEVLSQIADIFETSTDYLIERTDVKKPYPRWCLQEIDIIIQMSYNRHSKC